MHPLREAGIYTYILIIFILPSRRDTISTFRISVSVSPARRRRRRGDGRDDMLRVDKYFGL